MSVLKLSDNLNVDGYYHPHLGSGGDVCLGNMGELYNEAIANGDVFAAIDAIMAVLLNYNNGDPYISLARFAERSRQIQPNGEILGNAPEQQERQEDDSDEERVQSHECPECGESNEVYFEAGSDYSHHECDECGVESEYEYE